MRILSVFALVVLAGACASHPNPPPQSVPLTVVLAGERPDGGASFAGAQVCRGCHGAIYRFWMGSEHAGSMTSLDADGQGDNPACLRCHSTGYGERTGHGGAEGTEGLASVSCESCHGPAARHAAGGSPGREPVEAGADCPPCETHRICRTCHTPVHSPSFRYADYLEKVSCGDRPGEGGAAGDSEALPGRM